MYPLFLFIFFRGRSLPHLVSYTDILLKVLLMTSAIHVRLLLQLIWLTDILDKI